MNRRRHNTYSICFGFLSFIYVLLLGFTQDIHAAEITKSETFSFKSLALSKVKVSNQYGNLNIITTKSDSIYIDVNLSVILDTKEDSADFFKGVRYNAYASGKLTSIELLVDPQYASNFKFTSNIDIHAPDSLIWLLSNKFGNINCDTSFVVQSLSLDYGKLRGLSLLNPKNELSEISFFQADVKVDTVDNALLHSENSILEFGTIKSGIIKSEFSTWLIKNAENLNLNTETDNIEIKNARVLTLKGMYSDCSVNVVREKLETELVYGKFVLSGIEPEFKTVNINHNNVFTNLNILDTTPFYLNAHVKYCDLVIGSSVANNIKTIHDGAIKIMNGLIGNKETDASVNIVARFENINLNKR